jgi:O-antigen ligase
VHLEGIFRGVEITRTFDFMPRMLAFSVAFLLVFNEKRLFSFILLIINLLAIFITYTRSYLINVAIIFLFYFILIGFKKKSLKLVLKNVLIYGVLGFFGFIMLSKFLPANTEFFLDRFANIAKSSNSGEINTLEYRFLMTGKVISNIDENKRVFGMGSVTENQISWIPAMRLATSDMVWAGVIFRWGFVGLILFTMLYIFSIFSSFSFYMKSEGALSDLALFFLLFIISQIVESFVSWTFLNGHGFAVGLWYFAMLSALFGFNKSKLLSKNKIFSND